MLSVMPGLVLLPIPLLAFAAIYFLLRWWPLRRLRHLAEHDALGTGASRIEVMFGGTPVSPTDCAALYGPGGITSAPPELALKRFNRWAFTTIKWSDDDRAIRFVGQPPKWLRSALVTRAAITRNVHV